MAVTQITAGQEDWLSTLNSDLSQIGDKVSSSQVGITFINGCSGSAVTTCYLLGGRHLNITVGNVSLGSALTSSSRSIDFGKLATDTDVGQGVAWAYASNWAANGVITRSGTTLTLTANAYFDSISKGTAFNFLLVRSY